MVGTTVYMAPEVMNATDSAILGNKSSDDLVPVITSNLLHTVRTPSSFIQNVLCRSRLLRPQEADQAADQAAGQEANAVVVAMLTSDMGRKPTYGL